MAYDQEVERLHSWCRKCGTRVSFLVRGDGDRLLTPQEVEEAFRRLNEGIGWECPGFHTELSAMGVYWNFDKLVALYESVYPDIQEKERKSA